VGTVSRSSRARSRCSVVLNYPEEIGEDATLHRTWELQGGGRRIWRSEESYSNRL
jgi:hypothetical protein